MKKKFRVRKNEEFSKIIAQRHSLASNGFVVYSRKAKENYGRIGISVSKKLGNAVVRNKIKRQVRSMLDDFFDFNDEKVDLIIIVRNRYLSGNYEANKIELEKLLKKAIMKQ